MTESTNASQVLDASEPKAAVPPPNTQAPGASKSQTTPVDEKISGKLSLLTSRERQAVERERAAKSREAAADEKVKAMEAREARLSEFENLKNTNPIKALEMLGMSYNDLTQAALNDGNVTPDQKLQSVEAKFDSFVKSQEDAKRLQAEELQQQTEKQSQATIASFQVEIKNYLKENSARYELIEFENSGDLVYDVIDEHYNRTLEAAVKKATDAGEETASIRGDIMTIAQAADKVEAHLEKKYDKARSIKKVQTLFAPRQTLNVAKPTLPTSQKLKTLTNQQSATPAVPRKTARTDADRVAAAIAYAKGLRA